MSGPALVEDVPGGSATYQGVLCASVAVFDRETVQCHGHLLVQTQAGVAASIQANGKLATTTLNYANRYAGANALETLTLTWPLLALVDGFDRADVAADFDHLLQHLHAAQR